MKTHLILALGTAVLAAPVLAQQTDGEWRGLAGASLAISSGNTDSKAALLNLDLARATTDDKTSVAAYLNEGQSKIKGQTTTTAGKWGVAGQYDHNITPVLFGFGKLGFDHDRPSDLSLRTLVAAGLGYHVIQTKTDSFDVFGGVSYNRTGYRVEKTIGGNTKKDFSSVGLLLGEESSHQMTDTVFAKQRIEYYPGLTGEKAQLIKATGALNVAMTKTMSLTVGVMDTFNSKVSAGQKKNDLSVFTGVSMKLGS
jgi:putative salt-induced outer membrane protein